MFKIDVKYHLIVSVLLLLVTFGIGLSSIDAEAQAPSPPYDVNTWTYTASAGGVSGGNTYGVRGTLGQPSVHTSTGADHAVSGGIWQGADQLWLMAPDVLVLEKEYRDLTAPVEVGDELTFIVAVTNNGNEPQTNVTVTDTIPTGLTLTPGTAEIDSDKGSIQTVTGDAIVVQAQQLSYEQIAVLTYRATVDAGMEGQVISSTATARSDTYGPITDTLAITVLKPNVVYLPLMMRHYAATPPEPEIKTVSDAPNRAPGYAIAVDTHIYREDFDHENDNDWYAFQTEQGQTYTIETEVLGAEADTWLALCDPDAEAKLAENDDIAWPHDVASRIVWTAPDHGTYQLLVRSYDWRVYGPETDYQLQVRRGDHSPAPSSMEMEAETDPQTPKPLVPPTPAPGGER